MSREREAVFLRGPADGARIVGLPFEPETISVPWTSGGGPRELLVVRIYYYQRESRGADGAWRYTCCGPVRPASAYSCAHLPPDWLMKK